MGSTTKLLVGAAAIVRVRVRVRVRLTLNSRGSGTPGRGGREVPMSRVSGVSRADYSGQSLEAAIVIFSLGNFCGIISHIVPCFLDANLVIYCSSKSVSYSTSFYNEFPLKEKNVFNDTVKSL